MSADNSWDELAYKRRLETFDANDDSPVLASGPGREIDGIWYHLTSKQTRDID